MTLHNVCRIRNADCILNKYIRKELGNNKYQYNNKNNCQRNYLNFWKKCLNTRDALSIQTEGQDLL
jgi:hypothetical protein